MSPDTGLIDYDGLASTAAVFKPRLVVAGASAYPREWDYGRMREVADSVGAYLMTDMAHISGLVATGEADDPFRHSDVVTTTTHKSLRGPRSGIIFYRLHLKEQIDFAVFPSLQGGPHNHQIAALAVALKESGTPEFKLYAQRIKANAAALAASLKKRGYTLATGGTDNHLVLWNVRELGLTGSKLEKLLERAGISVNKNAIHGDKSAVAPGGVRLGTPAMTTRGLTETDFDIVAGFLQKAADLALEVQDKSGKKLPDFLDALDADFKGDVEALREEVELFASAFPMPGPIEGGPLP